MYEVNCTIEGLVPLMNDRFNPLLTEMPRPKKGKDDWKKQLPLKMKKALIICIVGMLFIAGCGGSKKNCKYTIEIEYGKNGYIQVSDFIFVTKKDGQFYVIKKDKVFSPRTSEAINITEFVLGKTD